MDDNLYFQLISSRTITVDEVKASYHMITERHIQAMWLEQKYFKDLKTEQGFPITVISPGIWNLEAGPDFRKAHLIIDGQHYRGDIEIHLADDGWYDHNHEVDERYNDVVLHLSLIVPKNSKPLRMKNGKDIRKAYFEPYLTISLSRILQLIDLDLYPYKKFLGSGKCSQSLFKMLPEENIKTLFKSAAEWRLDQKRRYLATRFVEKTDQLAGGIAMALGYKHNTEVFLELFQFLKNQSNFNEQQVLAVGMGMFGFFEEHFQKKWNHSAYFNQLNDLWDQFPGKSQKYKLFLHQVRPLNHPVRRLAYLACLLTDPSISDLYQKIIENWDSNWSLCHTHTDWVRLRAHFVGMIPDYRNIYWNFHYTFENEKSSDFLPLVGESLRLEIIVNTVLPLLLDRILQRKPTGSNFDELQAFEKFYGFFPAGKTSKSQYLIHRFFGETSKGLILNKAMMEQGAYQVHRDFCIHFEASCEGCPFVDNYKESSSLICR